ncbi:MAG: hypothetical protein ACI89E_001452, partial [Planctomycetota bacterium]
PRISATPGGPHPFDMVAAPGHLKGSPGATVLQFW